MINIIKRWYNKRFKGKMYCSYCKKEVTDSTQTVPDFKKGGLKIVCKDCKMYHYYKYGI